MRDHTAQVPMLAQFHIVVFAMACATVMERLRQQHCRRKRYADLMIAAIVIAGQHILVTRNRTDCIDVLPTAQLATGLMILQMSRDGR